MAVGKKTAIGVAILGALLLAGIRSDVRTRAESRPPLTTADAVKHFRPFLNGSVASDDVAAGFQSAEDLVATLHASRNIRVPFMVLKHQVVDEGKPLAAAIQAVKPTANASLEADLARSEARADLAAIK
jgi:hypothetical protein